MDALILGIFSFSMVLLCIVLVFFVLMQKPNADAGMGASLGGGAAESAFGGEASNMLTKLTVRAVVLYFILAFCLYLGYIYAANPAETAETKPTTESVLKTLTTEPVAETKAETAPVVESEVAPVADVTAISEIEMPETTNTQSPVEETAK